MPVQSAAGRGLLASRHGRTTHGGALADTARPSVEIVLADATLDDVVSVANRYRDVERVELVPVVSDDFIVIRHAANADLEATREQSSHKSTSVFN
jgi:hypothetical protein